MKKISILAVISIFLIPSAFAFGVSPFMMIGYGSLDEKAGAEISLGAQLKPIERVKLDIAPLTGIFRRKDDPRFSRERNDDKETVCRDKATGQDVDTKNCGLNFKYAFESSLKIQIFDHFEIGGGARIADGATYYGLAVVKFTDVFGIEGKFGDDYVSGLFRVDF